MIVTVSFYSWFKEQTGCPQVVEDIPENSTLGDLIDKLLVCFPKLAPAQRSMLTAVGLDYQPRGYLLKPGDEVSLFPPVQGG